MTSLHYILFFKIHESCRHNHLTMCIIDANSKHLNGSPRLLHNKVYVNVFPDLWVWCSHHWTDIISQVLCRMYCFYTLRENVVVAGRFCIFFKCSLKSGVCASFGLCTECDRLLSLHHVCTYMLPCNQDSFFMLYLVNTGIKYWLPLWFH